MAYFEAFRGYIKKKILRLKVFLNHLKVCWSFWKFWTLEVICDFNLKLSTFEDIWNYLEKYSIIMHFWGHFRGLYFEAIFTAMTMGIVVMFKVEYVFLCIPIFVCRKVLVVYRRHELDHGKKRKLFLLLTIKPWHCWYISIHTETGKWKIGNKIHLYARGVWRLIMLKSFALIEGL